MDLSRHSKGCPESQQGWKVVLDPETKDVPVSILHWGFKSQEECQEFIRNSFKKEREIYLQYPKVIERLKKLNK